MPKRRKPKSDRPVWPFPIPRLLWVAPIDLHDGDRCAVLVRRHFAYFGPAPFGVRWLMEPLMVKPFDDYYGKLVPGEVEVVPEGWRIGGYLIGRAFASNRRLVALVA